MVPLQSLGGAWATQAGQQAGRARSAGRRQWVGGVRTAGREVGVGVGHGGVTLGTAWQAAGWN